MKEICVLYTCAGTINFVKLPSQERIAHVALQTFFVNPTLELLPSYPLQTEHKTCRSQSHYLQNTNFPILPCHSIFAD